MSYARNLLSRGEEVVFESRQHWFAVLAQTWAWVIGAVIAFALLLWVGTNTDIGGATMDGILTLVLLVVLIVALARIGLVIWAWRNQEYLVTTRRIIKSEGIFNKEMGDSSLEKVNDAHLTQSWIGRIFDYGTLDILTAAEEGGGPIDDYPMLAEPVKFKIAMLNQKERLERPDLAPPPSQRPATSPALQRAEPMPPRAGSDRVSEVRSEPTAESEAEAATPAPAPSTDAPGTPGQLASTLESLAGLRDRGLITPDEYEAKKRELLERM
ncbi:MAG TPA: PH domain-containing protein [Candidatus Dormibacteraeota bacterium]|nr:PH domain-containing protein [Candidatus Dormibacteraeota bacterium]